MKKTRSGQKSWLAMLVFVAAFALVTKASAQDSDAFVKSLFAPGVEIVDIEVYPSSHWLHFDDGARELIIEGNRYPYPEQIERVAFYRQDGNRLFIQVSESRTSPSHVGRWWVWTFDLTNRQFSAVDAKCGQRTRLEDSDIRIGWVFVSEANGSTSLCAMDTGIHPVTLPSDLSWSVYAFYDGYLPIFVSPDRNWLLLFGENADGTWAYSFHVADGSLNRLGLFPAGTFVFSWGGRWLGDTVMIETMNRESVVVFRAQASNSDSLREVLSRYNYAPEFFSNPPRYEYINLKVPSYGLGGDCQRITYDVLNDVKQVTELGGLCRPEWGSLDGIAYYRDVVANGAEGIAALTRFDAAAMETEVLYEGEIEWIDWVSEDERYASVVLDSSGRIDTPPYFNPLFSWGIPDVPRMALVDLQEDRILFEMPVGWKVCTDPLGGPDLSWYAGWSRTALGECSSIGPTGAIFVREGGAFLAVGNKSDPYGPRPLYTDAPLASYAAPGSEVAVLLELEADEIQTTTFAKGWLFAFSSDYLLELIKEDDGTHVSYRALPVDGSTPINITEHFDAEDFRSFRLVDRFPAENAVRFRIDTFFEGNVLAGYVTVKIPQ
ncbi:MAG: hypothetical protein HUU31_18725 [Anaerolineae bacterium]|nr:hypothetical protein [Anaerolineae bacterium]